MDDNVLIVAASAEEIPHLGAPVFITGIGKINATFSLTKKLLEDRSIKRVINIGTAGSVDKHNLKSMLRCTSFIQGDMNCEPLGFPATQTPYEEQFNTIKFGEGGAICSTQDSFVVKVPDHSCDAVDMEAYSLAKVCKLLRKKFYCYKFISDVIGVELQEDVWESNKAKGVSLFKKVLLDKHNVLLGK